MSIVIANSGDQLIAQYLCNKATPENLVLHLYTNNVTPAKNSNVATFTEASGSGYSAITLTAANWTVTEGTGNGTTATTCTQPVQVFTLTGALSAYGYFVTGATSNALYFAELFSSGPYTTPSGGGTIQITPTVTSN